MTDDVRGLIEQLRDQAFDRYAPKDMLREAAAALSAALAREEALRREIAHLQHRNRLGEGAIQVLAAISALIPLKDSLTANRTGKSLVDYLRAALENTNGN